MTLAAEPAHRYGSLLRLTPPAFSDDRFTWAHVRAQVLAWRGDSVRARAYADSAVHASAEVLEGTTRLRVRFENTGELPLRPQGIINTHAHIDHIGGAAKLKAATGAPVYMNAADQDGLTALDYTQSRGFMPFMALQTPLYEEEAALLRELGASVEMETHSGAIELNTRAFPTVAEAAASPRAAGSARMRAPPSSRVALRRWRASASPAARGLRRWPACRASAIWC